ncbi:MAG: toll/interleukin-1 receptor domain-containing protein [Anaerolineales bacterium]|nr:toll/interleukin-1 receptor domain-containing protein [Anaerolineales bacterium]
MKYWDRYFLPFPRKATKRISLRAGVPEAILEQTTRLFTVTIEQYYSCFISYSSKDKEFAEQLYRDLRNAGVHCWFAPEDLKTGEVIRASIENSIRKYDKLLIILSENSLSSDWVASEVEAAQEEERKRHNRTILFPIRLDDEIMDTDEAWAAEIRRTRHIGDFSQWQDHDAYYQAFERLLWDLKVEG